MTNTELCLGISGSYEGGNGQPRWDLLTGDFDQQGLSAGCIQWAAGQGSLRTLLQEIFKQVGHPSDATTLSAIRPLVDMDAQAAMRYCRANFINLESRTKDLTPAAKALWSKFLSSPASIAAQKALVERQVMGKALALVPQFLPWDKTNLRAIAFMFDVAVQSGGMSNKSGRVTPVEKLGDAPLAGEAILFAKGAGQTRVALQWSSVIKSDPLAATLLHYAYARAKLGRPQYIWDALSRRGTIACRLGTVHGKAFDFTKLLP